LKISELRLRLREFGDSTRKQNYKGSATVNHTQTYHYLIIIIIIITIIFTRLGII